MTERTQSRKYGERFTAIPFRVFQAREGEEISPRQFQILCWLAYRCERDRGQTAFRLQALKDELGLTCSREQLRNDVAGLAPAWLEVEAPPPGSTKGVWKARLADARTLREGEEIGAPPSVLQIQTPSDLEESSNGGSGLGAANPQAEADSAPTAPPRDGASLSDQSLALSKSDPSAAQNADLRSPDDEVNDAHPTASEPSSVHEGSGSRSEVSLDGMVGGDTNGFGNLIPSEVAAHLRARQAIMALVAVLADADPRTATTFAEKFPTLKADDFDACRAYVLRSGSDLDRPGAAAYRFLERRQDEALAEAAA